jgi:hypothetical protein
VTDHPGSFVAGVLFIIIGGTFFGESLGWWTVAFDRLWPLLLIAVGATILLNAYRSKRREDAE